MHKYILKRLILLIPVLIGVSLVVFMMMEITPGDPARQMAGADASEEAVEQLRDELGLNDPAITRFVRYMWDACHGDLGKSYTTKAPVIDEIMKRFPTTFTLACLSTLIAGCTGILLGIVSATHQYSILDRFATVFALLGVSMPVFWLGMMLIVFFSVKLAVLPSSGFSTPLHWIMPAVAVGYRASAIITRQTRSSMLEVIRQDYIRTARAKGQTEKVVIYKHALKNALIPVITVLGLQFGAGLGGAVVTETVFSISGLGKLMVDSINARNYPMVQGGVLVIACVFTLVNLAVDVLYAYLDPRIKSQYGGRVKAKKLLKKNVTGKEAGRDE